MSVVLITALNAVQASIVLVLHSHQETVQMDSIVEQEKQHAANVLLDIAVQIKYFPLFHARLVNMLLQEALIVFLAH
jgi:hypothetical protein